MEKYNLGDIAEVLISGTSFVTKLMHGASIGVGIFLLIMAFSLFKAHRSNPKFVPLERPIIYVILSIILIALPFYGRIFTPTGGTHDLQKLEAINKGVQAQDIDAPLQEWGDDYDH